MQSLKSLASTVSMNEPKTKFLLNQEIHQLSLLNMYESQKALKAEPLSSVFSTRETFLSVSAGPHCEVSCESKRNESDSTTSKHGGVLEQILLFCLNDRLGDDNNHKIKKQDEE